jgi:hypothetical protein
MEDPDVRRQARVGLAFGNRKQKICLLYWNFVYLFAHVSLLYLDISKSVPNKWTEHNEVRVRNTSSRTKPCHLRS